MTLARKRSIPLGALRNERFILLESKSDITQRFVTECAKVGFCPNAPLHASRHRVLLRAVQNGLGITVSPKRMTESYLSAVLVTVPFKEQLFTTVGFVWAGDVQPSQLMQDFMQGVHDNLGRMGSLSYNLLD